MYHGSFRKMLKETIHESQKCQRNWDLNAQISEEDKTAIETSITNLKDALSGSDSELIKQETENLNQASMKLGEAIYKSQQEQAETPTENVNEADVVDAEFETVNDKP